MASMDYSIWTLVYPLSIIPDITLIDFIQQNVTHYFQCFEGQAFTHGEVLTILIWKLPCDSLLHCLQPSVTFKFSLHLRRFLIVNRDIHQIPCVVELDRQCCWCPLANPLPTPIALKISISQSTITSLYAVLPLSSTGCKDLYLQRSH